MGCDQSAQRLIARLLAGGDQELDIIRTVGERRLHADPRGEAKTQVIAGATAPERRLSMTLGPDLRPRQVPERLLPLADRLHIQMPVEPEGRARSAAVGKEVGAGWPSPCLDLIFRLPESSRDLGAIPGGG